MIVISKKKASVGSGKHLTAHNGNVAISASCDSDVATKPASTTKRNIVNATNLLNTDEIHPTETW